MEGEQFFFGKMGKEYQTYGTQAPAAEMCILVLSPVP